MNKSKTKKIILNTIYAILIVFILVSVWISYLMFFPFEYQIGKISTEVWNSEQVFDLDYTVQLEKEENEDFVVLNLADIQLNNFNFFDGKFRKAKELITKLVQDKDPDLITLLGDNTHGTNNSLYLKELTKFMDSFNIPWAPVMGNHDDDGSGDDNWEADIFQNSKNCVIKKGPQGMGTGNYVISITENEEIVQALIMMDSQSDAVLDIQQDWYTWVVNGLADLAGHSVDTTVMFHIPLVEYDDAWNYWVASGYDENIGIGEKNETVCSSDTNNGFFDLMKLLGSTKNVICGHDHINNYSILFEGVRLTYCVKSSFGSYYYDDMLGGTVFSISATGTDIEQYII